MIAIDWFAFVQVFLAAQGRDFGRGGGQLGPAVDRLGPACVDGLGKRRERTGGRVAGADRDHHHAAAGLGLLVQQPAGRVDGIVEVGRDDNESSH